MLQAHYCNCAASFISPLSMESKCLRAWGLSSKTWGLSDLDPYLIANQIREFLKLGSNCTCASHIYQISCLRYKCGAVLSIVML